MFEKRFEILIEIFWKSAQREILWAKFQKILIKISKRFPNMVSIKISNVASIKISSSIYCGPHFAYAPGHISGERPGQPINIFL